MGKPMTIIVKTFANEEVIVEANASDTLAAMKARLPIPPHPDTDLDTDVHFVQKLSPHIMLSEYKIQDGDTLHVVDYWACDRVFARPGDEIVEPSKDYWSPWTGLDENLEFLQEKQRIERVQQAKDIWNAEHSVGDERNNNKYGKNDELRKYNKDCKSDDKKDRNILNLS